MRTALKTVLYILSVFSLFVFVNQGFLVPGTYDRTRVSMMCVSLGLFILLALIASRIDTGRIKYETEKDE